MQKLYFLGPKGTYCENAAKKVIELIDFKGEMIEISTIAKVVQMVGEDKNSIAVLPIENSIEGIVRPSVDNLYLSDVKIKAQIDIKIEHCFISKGDKNSIKHIISHPQALAQSSKYITDNFDENIDLISANSTASAINFLLDKDNSYGAIGSEILANELNLNILDKNIGDIKENKTRFVVVSKNDINFGKNDRTSIVFNTKNESGALLKILEIFKKYNLNLIYLESRPSKKVFGEYNFFADIDKGLDDIELALLEVKKECNFYKLLGSYKTIS